MLRVFETNSFKKGFSVQQPLVEKKLILQVNTERNNLLYNFLIVFISWEWKRWLHLISILKIQ